nr:hypothetical protein [Tanacetum cinerariifolium]
MVSVDSMLNWNKHEAEHKPREGEQVYGLMAGFKSDSADPAINAAGSVYDAAEFAMMEISPKILPKSDVTDLSPLNGVSSCSIKENVKPPIDLSTTADRFIPAASKNRSASIHTGRSIPAASRNRPASIQAGRSIPAASRNRPASIHAGRHIS